MQVTRDDEFIRCASSKKIKRHIIISTISTEYIHFLFYLCQFDYLLLIITLSMNFNKFNVMQSGHYRTPKNKL